MKTKITQGVREYAAKLEAEAGWRRRARISRKGGAAAPPLPRQSLDGQAFPLYLSSPSLIPTSRAPPPERVAGVYVPW